jgi:2-polyprenyl-3-methyl-5-hydroxy-6-metoxy-1,4-benzoquinol methylase
MNTAIQINEDIMARQQEAFMGKMLEALNGFFDIHTIYIGNRLGLYKPLAGPTALTAKELAVRTGNDERYVREWLEAQTVSGILDVDDAEASSRERRYRLPAGHTEVLCDQESVNYLAPVTRMAVGAALPLEAIVSAFRTGGGVSFADYGADMRQGVGELNRPLFMTQLGDAYLPSIPDIHRRLSADPAARVADVGCGTGWSSIGMAKSYPKIRVDGFDLDPASIEEARAHAREEGFSDRVRFDLRDAGDPSLSGQYDLVTAFETIHDMADPVRSLRNMLRLAGPTGSVIVMDERTAERFTPEGNEIERILYGFSILSCLPAGRFDSPSAETGTVMRPETLREYAREAGFSELEILPIDNFFFRFYRLKTNNGPSVKSVE